MCNQKKDLVRENGDEVLNDLLSKILKTILFKEQCVIFVSTVHNMLKIDYDLQDVEVDNTEGYTIPYSELTSEDIRNVVTIGKLALPDVVPIIIDAVKTSIKLYGDKLPIRIGVELENNMDLDKSKTYIQEHLDVAIPANYELTFGYVCK